MIQLIFYLFLSNSAQAQVESFFKTEKDGIFHFYSPKMGTLLEIFISPSNNGDIVEKIHYVLTEIDRLTLLFSEFEDKSDVSRINKSAQTSETVEVSSETIEILEIARNMFYATQGAFAITFASFLNNGIFLSFDKSDKIKENIDIKNILINSSEKTVKILNHHVKIGLGGIAKGYILRETGAMLKMFGENNFLINAGGDIFANGTRQEKKWVVGIKNPWDKEIPFMQLVKNDENSLSVATSGDYERFILYQGKKYSHIIDPRTGLPSERVISATVIGPDPIIADVLATALMVFTKEERIVFFKNDKHEINEIFQNYEIVLIDKDGRIFKTSMNNGKFKIFGGI